MAREKFCVGIDIGASSVKLCQLKKGKQGLCLAHFGMVPLPAETVVDGSLMNSARVVEAVQELIASHRVKQKQAAIAISGHAVIIKKISLPQMSHEELEESMQWEAEQFIPFDIADVNLDVQIVNPESEQKGQMDVMLVAAKKDYVNEYTSAIMEAGLEPVVCDVDAFTVENMFEANYDTSPGETVALVNIGASKTNINVLVDGVSSFTRDLNIGGHAFTEEIQRQLSVSREEAEELKIGAPGASSQHTAGPPPEVTQAIDGVAENVTSEIQRTLDFYSATSADPPPAKLYLCGGTSRLEPLQKALNTRMGLPVEPIDPFRKIDTTNQDRDYLASLAPVAGVAVGLGLRYVGDQP